MRADLPRGLTPITREDDIYRVGTLCQAKAIYDKQNPFSPYALNLYCVEKAKIVNFIDQVMPLSRVEVALLTGEMFTGPQGTALTETDLPEKELVIFKFLKQQYLKCFQIAPDDKFVQYLQFLERNFDTTRVYEFVHMLLTCVSLPQYINTYKFLVNVDSHALQDVYEEKELSLTLEKMNAIFTDFVNKIEIWSKLEQQYDFKAD